VQCKGDAPHCPFMLEWRRSPLHSISPSILVLVYVVLCSSKPLSVVKKLNLVDKDS
jgi:hypothetical protein